MHLVIIGGNSTKTLEGVIKTNFDDIDIQIYADISQFVNVNSVRTLPMDRLILVQDSFGKEVNLATKLTQFNNYVCDNYPAARVITLSKDESMAQTLAEIFISPYTAHLTVGKIRPKTIIDIASEPIDVIKERYGIVLREKELDSINDVVSLDKGKGIEKKDDKKKKKKKGLFGFLSKDKSNEIEIPTKDDVEEPVEETVDSEINAEVEGFEDSQEGVTESQEESFDNFDDFEDNDEDINFSMFSVGDESVDLGIGFENNKEPEASDDDQGDFDIRGNSGEEDFEDDDSMVDLTVFDSPKESGVKNDFGFDVIGEDEDLDFEDDIDLLSSSTIEQDKNNLDTIKKSMEEMEIDKEDVNINVSIVIPDVSIEEAEVSNDVNYDMLEKLQTAFEEENKPKIIEKIVEVEKVVHVQDKKAYRNGIRLIVVTGDRRSGVTRTAMNIASYFTKKELTLYVDLDTKRKGSLAYIGVEDIIDEEEHIQNGLNTIKIAKALPNVCYYFSKGKFDCLLSMYGTDVSEEQLANVQSILSLQRHFKTIVVDCPLENLKYLEDLIIYSEVIICVESNKSSVINTALGLSDVATNDKFASFISNNGQYLVTKGELEEFNSNLAYVRDIFSLDKEKLDSGVIPVIGVYKNMHQVLLKL